MDFVELYYTNVVGCYPSIDDDYKTKSQKIIDYLIDAGVDERKILQFVEDAPASDFLTIEMLPDSLWLGSLVKRNTFYYHNLLHIRSKPPRLDPLTREEHVEPFYLEMKIVFTVRDLINYFYDTLHLDLVLLDVKRDKAAFEYLLNKYERFGTVESIDFVLALIDFAAAQEYKSVRNVLDLSSYESEVNDLFKEKVAMAKLAKADRIVWR